MAQRGVDLCVFFASPADSMPRVRVWPHREAFDGAVDRDNAFVWTVRDLVDLNKMNMIIRIVIMSGHMRYSVAKEEIPKQAAETSTNWDQRGVISLRFLPTYLAKPSKCSLQSVEL